jgi:hypothetical protein
MPSGVSADPDTDQRFVLDAQLGIFELLPGGQLIQLWQRPHDLPELTDLCAVGGGRFIAAADGDGYVIDIAAGSAKQHFCLEPGWDPGFSEDFVHKNRSVACDLENRLIYGQPQTVPQEGEPLPIRSEVASYSLISGDDLEWMELPDPAFHADGMTMLTHGRLLLAQGTELSVFDPSVGVFVANTDVAEHGIEGIQGLSFDPATGLVIVLDSAQSKIIELPLGALGFDIDQEGLESPTP